MIPPDLLLQVRDSQTYDDTMKNTLITHHKYNHVGFEVLQKTYALGQVEDFSKVMQLKYR